MKITTYRPSNTKRKRSHGFLRRKQKMAGRKVILRRRRKGRKVLTV